MHERNESTIALPESESQDVLTGILRRGARKLLADAIETEVTEWIDAHATVRDATGRRQVVRNGHLPARNITTGLGPVEVRQPRVRDRRPGADVERFSSKILPPYLRKAQSVEELFPWLYLKGISTGDFQEALTALVGPDCPGLSATTVTRLKSAWEAEYEVWNKRDLSAKQYVNVWADGVHFNVRLEDDRTCILVLMGATAEGTKELIAVVDGYRESEQSWTTLLLDVKARGLSIEPKLAVGDGALGFWKALAKAFPRPANNAAPCIRRPTCSTSCRSVYSRRPRPSSTTSGKPIPERMPGRPSTCSSRPMKPSSPRPLNACERIATCCSPTTTSRPSTGFIFARRTPSRAPSRPSAFATAWDRLPLKGSPSGGPGQEPSAMITSRIERFVDQKVTRREENGPKSHSSRIELDQKVI